MEQRRYRTLEELMNWHLSPLQIQSLYVCQKTQLGLEQPTGEMSRIVYVVPLPSAPSVRMAPLYSVSAVQSVDGDIVAVMRELIDKELVRTDASDPPRLGLLELTLRGKLALAKSLIDSNGFRGFTPVELANLPRVDIEVDHDHLYPVGVLHAAFTGYFDGEHMGEADPLKLVEQIDTTYLPHQDVATVQALIAYASQALEEVEDPDYEFTEEEIDQQRLVTELLQITYMELEASPDSHAILHVEDSRYENTFAWFLLDLDDVDAFEVLLLEREGNQLRGEAAVMDGGSGVLLLETYDRESDPTIPLSHQKPEALYVRWSPTLEEIAELREAQGGLGEDEVVVNTGHSAELFVPPSDVLQDLTDLHKDEERDPTSALSPTSIQYLPTWHPFATQLLGVIPEEFGELNLHLTKEAAYFSIAFGEQTIVTRLLKLDGLGDAIMHGLLNPGFDIGP